MNIFIVKSCLFVAFWAAPREQVYFSFEFEFYGPVNTLKVMSSQSFNLLTFFGTYIR